ncbi:ABC-2 type transporter [uncultured Desulfobacterium sp.]|uniref:ABC-2 type transporter n=1 Tax=uncultured Desulfobacterium sp. TaxID=201089 RepID=A0A445MZ35_9BACT|nr:ABC-2 type transporter [uncultured Desulfobacterium sp.]
MMTMWRRIIALTIKEFLALVKDRRSRTVLIVPPIIQLIIFGYAATFDLHDVPYAVYNEDRGVASRELLAAIEGSEAFRPVDYLEKDSQVAPIIDNKGATMVVHFGPEFTKDLLLKRPTELQVIVDGRDSNTALVVLGYLRSILIKFNEQWNIAHGERPPAARLNIRAWFNQNLESRWFIVPGVVGLLTLVVTTLVTALSVAREREAGTFDQLLVTPFRPVEILLGKTLPGLVIGVIEASIIILIAILWFNVPLRGSLAALYCGLFLFLLSTIGVGLAISSIAVTQQQGLLGAFLFIVPSIILSGFATPIANMPPLVQDITLINPMRYFLIILRSVFLEGANVSRLWPNYWPMALIGIINLTIASMLFRRRLY